MYDSMDMIDLLGLIISFLKREIYCIWWSPVWPHISVLVALSALPNLELLRDSAVNNMGNFSVWWLLQYIASSVSGPAAQSCLMCLEPSIEFYQKNLIWKPKSESWLWPCLEEISLAHFSSNTLSFSPRGISLWRMSSNWKQTKGNSLHFYRNSG